MLTRFTFSVASVLVVALSALPSAGCVQAETANERTETETAISIPLNSLGTDGRVYHLTAVFTITLPDGTQRTIDDLGLDPVLTVNLPAGRHSVHIEDGWVIERSDDGGARFTTVVPAFLAGSNPMDVVVVPGRTATLSLQFVVRETTGNLNINFGVIDQPRELVADFQVSSTSTEFAAYQGRSVSLVIYYTPGVQTTSYYYEGYSPYYYTYYRTHTTTVTGIEVLNDSLGLLKPIAGDLGGGTLSFTLRNRANGQQEFFGDYSSNKGASPDLSFGTSTTASFTGALGTFPDDVPFTASGSSVQLVSGGSVVLSGQLTTLTDYL
jgi:hypothetical protein